MGSTDDTNPNIRAPAMTAPLPPEPTSTVHVQPALGGWTPKRWTKLGLVFLGGAVVAVGAVVAAPIVTPGVIIGAALTGGGSAVLGWFGLSSAGTRKLSR